jgi:phage terminase Nu1 subunit (DNA packaging protein)
MKEQFNAIQSSVMDAASKEMSKIGQNLIGDLERLELTPTQKRAVAGQIEAAVDGVEKLVGGKAKEVFTLIKDEIDKKLDKIEIIPKELRKQIGNMCKGSVDQLSKLVNDAIGQASKSAKEVSGAILDQGLKALKSTFDIIGAWLKGEKTTAQAMTGIKGAWKETGKEVSKSFSEAKKSFVDKMGGKKMNSKEKTHADRVVEKQDFTTSRDR